MAIKSETAKKHKIENNREYMKRYRQTETYKKSMAKHRAWLRTPEGKKHRAIQAVKYRLSDKGRKYTEKKRLAPYGLSKDEYDCMLAAQGGGCRLCSGPPLGRGAFHIDHDHVSGKVRGLLCNKCNVGLGMFRDSPWLLELAAAYIRANKRANF